MKPFLDSQRGNSKDLWADMRAGLVVFLVALPLCLGISLASDAPIMSGIIAGAVGGIVIGLIGGSALGVSGPAAGLVTVVATSVVALGSYEIFLLAVVLAGVMQIGLGLSRAGVIAYYFPTAVIKGMLAAIVTRPDRTWFYKFTGDDALISAERSNFLQFVRSVKYP